MTTRGRPAYQPNDRDRRVVEMMAGWAIPNERIASVIGIDPKTLRKHFPSELHVGYAKLEAQLAQNLLRMSQGNDRQALIATIFALKARFGWVEAVPAKDHPVEPPLSPELAARRASLKPGPPPRAFRGTGNGQGWEELVGAGLLLRSARQ